MQSCVTASVFIESQNVPNAIVGFAEEAQSPFSVSLEENGHRRYYMCNRYHQSGPVNV